MHNGTSLSPPLQVCYKERTVVLLPHLYLFLAVVLIVVALYYFISSVYEATVSEIGGLGHTYQA